VKRVGLGEGLCPFPIWGSGGLPQKKKLNLATNITGSKILHIFNGVDVLKKIFSLQ